MQKAGWCSRQQTEVCLQHAPAGMLTPMTIACCSTCTTWTARLLHHSPSPWHAAPARLPRGFSKLRMHLEQLLCCPLLVGPALNHAGQPAGLLRQLVLRGQRRQHGWRHRLNLHKMRGGMARLEMAGGAAKGLFQCRAAEDRRHSRAGALPHLLAGLPRLHVTSVCGADARLLEQAAACRPLQAKQHEVVDRSCRLLRC